MSRSVSYLSNARHVTFINDNFEDDWSWDDFMENLPYYFDHLTSLTPCERWDDNETRIFLENSFAEIGVSEYCGLVSLSIRTHENDGCIKIGLAEHWIDKAWESILIRLDEGFRKDHLVKLGSFSNGEGIFKSRNN